MLRIENLEAGYTPNNLILKGVDIHLQQGDVVGILGRNGSGKSTLAKAICGLLPTIKNGEILFKGHSLVDLPSHKISRLGIGFFQQGGTIFPNMSVQENLLVAFDKMKEAEFNKRITELSEWIELLQKKDRLNMKASYLSGGEKHQLAMAMVLFRKPKLLILDEPSAGLTPANQAAIYDILRKIREDEESTMLIIEQNVLLVNAFAEKTIELRNGKILIN